MTTAEHYSIRDLELLSGIKAHTLRMWEKRYRVLVPARTATNIRHYSPMELKDLLNISTLQKKGYKISEIAAMSGTERARLLMMVVDNRDQDQLHDLMLQCVTSVDEGLFNQFFERALPMGFEQVFTRFIFPFFERVGLLWQTGTICTAQEHFFPTWFGRNLSPLRERYHR